MSASHCSITGSLKKSAGKGSLTNSLIGSLRGKGRKVSAQSSSGKEDIKGSYLDLDDDMFDGKIDGEFDAGFHGVGLVELSSQTHVRRPSLSNRKLSKTKTKTKVDRPSATGTTTASTDSVSGFETQDVVGGAEIKSSKIASPFDKEIAIESVPGTPAKETDMLLQQIDAGSPFLTTEEKNNRCESASSSDGEEQDTCAGAKNVEFSRMNNSRAKLSAVSVHEPLVS